MKAPRHVTRSMTAQAAGARQLSVNLRTNLIYLCSFYPSISEVCRRLGVNRQQFNKYVSGTAFPSLFVLTRIADFFGLEVEELCMPAGDLRQIFEHRRSPVESPAGAETFAAELQGLSASSSPMLDSFVGLYHRYYYAFDQSGAVVRSLFSIRKAGGAFRTRHIERISYGEEGRQRTTFKYDGLAVAASNCIFVTEIETLLKSCISSASFPIIPRPGQSLLFGIQTSLSSSAGRPGASRVVLERILPSVTIRQAFGKCGIFPSNHPGIRPEILALIGNANSTSTTLFLPRVL